MRFLWLFFLCLASGGALAQSVPNPNSPINTNCSATNTAACTVWTPSQWIGAWESKVDTTNGVLTGPTISGGSSAGSTITGAAISSSTFSGSTINSTSSTGYQQYGGNALFITAGGPYGQGVFIGPGAGAYAQSNNLTIAFGTVGIGVASLQSLTNIGGENTCGGALSCQYLTTAFGDTGWGEHVIGAETTANDISAFGNDAMRDTVGNTGSTAMGIASQDDGVGSSNTTLGAFTLSANAGLITISGSPTVNDQYCIPFTTTNASVTGLPASACYTASSTSATTLASGLASAISNLGVYTPGQGPSGYGTQLAASNQSTGGGQLSAIRLHFPGGNTTGWAIQPGTPTCTGSCTATLTVQAPFSGSYDIGIGVWALSGVQLYGAASALMGIGDYSLGGLVGTHSKVICIGAYCGNVATSADNSVIIGQYQARNATTISNDAIVSAYLMDSLTSGTSEAVLGGGNCISSGNQNTEVGFDSCVPSLTTSYQLSIGNGIYGLHLSGTGATISPGQIGIMNAAPTATLDVLGPDTSTTLAFRVQNSTPANVFSVTDAGVIQTGSGGFTANGTTSLSLTSVGPASAHATVQEWLTVTDSAGNVRYIPAF